MRYHHRKFFPRKHSQSGVTLVEILVCMGLLSGLLLVLVSLFISAADVQTQTRGYSAVTATAEFIMARLDYDISHASSITSPSSVGTSASSLVLSESGISYTYALSGNYLQLTDGSGTDTLNGNDTTVSSVSFSESDSGSSLPMITYSFTLTSTALQNGVADTQSFSASQELR